MKKLLYSGMIALMTFFAVGNAQAEEKDTLDLVKVTVMPDQWVLGSEDAPEIAVDIMRSDSSEALTGFENYYVEMTLSQGETTVTQKLEGTQTTMDVEKLTLGKWAISYRLISVADNTKVFPSDSAVVDAETSTDTLTVISVTDKVKVTIMPEKWQLGTDAPICGVEFYSVRGGDPVMNIDSCSIMVTLKKGDDVVKHLIKNSVQSELNTEGLSLGKWAISYQLVEVKDSTKAFEGDLEMDIEGSTAELMVVEAVDNVKITVMPEKWVLGSEDAPEVGVEIFRELGDAQTGFDDYFIMMTLTKGSDVIMQTIKKTQETLNAEKLSLGEWEISYKLINAKDSTKDVTVAQIDENSTFKLSVVEKSANENNELAGVSVYPNPSNGEFNVVVPVRAEVEIFAANGAVVKRFAVAEGTTQVRLNNSGVYFVRFTAQNGQVAVKRVVVR